MGTASQKPGRSCLVWELDRCGPEVSGEPGLFGPAWCDLSQAGWRLMFWFWLRMCCVGIQAAQHVKKIRERRRKSNPPPLSAMWPGLRPARGQLKPEPVAHICTLFYCCSILRRYAQRATNKAQFHLVPIYIDWNLPPLPPRMWTHIGMHHSECKGTDLKLKQHSSAAPAGYMTGLYLKEKRHAGADFKSEEQKYMEKSPLWQISFSFRNNFVPFLQRDKHVQMKGGREKGGIMFFFFCEGGVMKTNWQAVTIYLSWLRGCIDI